MKVRKKAEAKQKYDCEAYTFALCIGVPHPSRDFLERIKPIWKCCGPSLMADWTDSKKHPGQRPFAWWHFDAPGKRDFDQHPNQWDALNDWGLLEDWEIDAINAQWREWFGDDYYEFDS